MRKPMQPPDHSKQVGGAARPGHAAQQHPPMPRWGAVFCQSLLVSAVMIGLGLTGHRATLRIALGPAAVAPQSTGRQLYVVYGGSPWGNHTAIRAVYARMQLELGAANTYMVLDDTQ